MRSRCERLWAPGLTLVEVLAGTALLGTLLVAILLARGEFAQQNRRARQTLEACRVLDVLMERWRVDAEGMPPAAAAPLAGRPGWSWRTRTESRSDAAILGAEVVIVEIFTSDSRDPVVAVEILTPIPEQDQDAKERTDIN